MSDFGAQRHRIGSSLASEGGVAELGFPQGLVDLPKCRCVGASVSLSRFHRLSRKLTRLPQAPIVGFRVRLIG